MMKIPSTSQSSVLAFENRVALLYFNILTRKMTDMGFDAFMPNVDLYFSFKWFKNHLNPIIVAQYIAEIRQYVKATKIFFFYSWLHFLSCTLYSLFITSKHHQSSNYLLNSCHLMIESLNLQKHEVFTIKIHRNTIFTLQTTKCIFSLDS